jgi:hypothetical protein
MAEGVLGQPLLLELALSDRASGRFPRARIIDDTGAQIGAALDMTEAAAWSGLYQTTWPVPVAGMFSAVFEVWMDALYSVPADYEAAVEGVRIVDPQDVVDDILDADLNPHLTAGTVGESLKLAFAEGGGAVRDDALTWDSNNRPLTMRRRIFPDAATAAASTAGGTGEGEVITITVDATHVSAVRWGSLLRLRQ